MFPIDFTSRIYCLITGASRGIGRQIAIEIARKVNDPMSFVTLVLLARSEAGLNETRSAIQAVNSSPNVKIFTKPLDLSVTSRETFESIFRETYKTGDYDSSIIFHNAGQIGNIERTIELTDKNVWHAYYDLNVFSTALLNTVFLKAIKDDCIVSSVFIVNITSLVGRKPFKYLSMYGSGKAARDMYFKVVAEEEPGVIVLNYSPGMVETSMANELIGNITQFEDSEILAATRENPTKLTPQQTTLKMLMLLEKGEFKSGDIIDFYD